MPQPVVLDDVLKSFRACAPLFAALGDPFRQDIILLLAEAERLNVNEIAARMTLSRPAISHHLKVLRQAGLVTLERVSRENFYALALGGAGESPPACRAGGSFLYMNRPAEPRFG